MTGGGGVPWHPEKVVIPIFEEIEKDSLCMFFLFPQLSTRFEVFVCSKNFWDPQIPYDIGCQVFMTWD